MSINTGSGADTAELRTWWARLAAASTSSCTARRAEKVADVAWFDHAYAYGNINVRGGDGADCCIWIT